MKVHYCLKESFNMHVKCQCHMTYIRRLRLTGMKYIKASAHERALLPKRKVQHVSPDVSVVRHTFGELD